MTFLEQVGEIAREAGRFVRGMADNRALRVEEKGSSYDFVTEADTGSQQLIVRRVAERFPGDPVIGEEDNLSDAEVMARIAAAPGRVWLVDPLDGTVNFIRGLGGYAVSVAVFESGEATCGAIYLPETDELYLAQKGGGATRNGVPIHVAEHADLTAAIGATHVPVSDMALRRRALKWNAHAIMASQNLRILGSSARTQAKVASGGIDYYYEYGPHPWDVAAGYVIVTEAGGVVTRLDGGPFDYALGSVLCASKAIHGEALRLLNATDEGLSVLP
ncbi:MAG: inositol monophosphatase [Clostridia bacterium]|nr:inositol monophosphatase [Clostridia bacterium]